jgi:hypothetical protein
MIKYFHQFIFLLLFITSTLEASDSFKITIIERITQFIQWPEIKHNFNIGIYQDKSLTKEMKEDYVNKKIHRSEIKIYNIDHFLDKNIDKLNLLYFTKDSSKDIDLILKKIKNKPILIITEFPDGVYNGMHLGIYYKDKKLKFIINKKNLDDSQLKASYKILRLAKIVEDKK